MAYKKGYKGKKHAKEYEVDKNDFISINMYSCNINIFYLILFIS